MKMKFALAARILLGLVFFVFGLNGLVMVFTGSGFITMPPMPEAAGAFMGALVKSGYMIPLLKVTETTVGVLLLSGFFVPLALIVITPVIYNIFLFHCFLAPEGLPLAIVLVLLHGFLTYMYWGTFCGLLEAKPEMGCCDHDHEHEHKS